jgi:hypothetical protein
MLFYFKEPISTKIVINPGYEKQRGTNENEKKV